MRTAQLTARPRHAARRPHVRRCECSCCDHRIAVLTRLRKSRRGLSSSRRCSVCTVSLDVSRSWGQQLEGRGVMPVGRKFGSRFELSLAERAACCTSNRSRGQAGTDRSTCAGGPPWISLTSGYVGGAIVSIVGIVMLLTGHAGAFAGEYSGVHCRAVASAVWERRPQDEAVWPGNAWHGMRNGTGSANKSHAMSGQTC